MVRSSTPFKLISILFVSAFLFIIQQAVSYTSGPGTGLTGAPGESNCTSCHSGTAVSNSSNVLVFTNMANGQYIPDSTYQIRLRAKKTSCVKFGFSTTMLNNNASPTKLGTLQLPTGSSGIQLSTGTRDYISHNSSGTSAIYTDSTDWVFNWKAPATLAGDARLYVAVNASNNSSTSSGDQILLKDFTFPQTTNVPVASITTNVISVCQGDSIFFQGSGTNGTTSYQWTFPGGTPASSTQQNIWVKFTSSGNKVCSLRVANSIMNSAYATKTVTILASPITNISYNSTTVLCEGDSISVSTTNNVNYSYQWQKNGSNISGAISAQYFAKSTGAYRVIVTNNNGCNVITNAVQITFNAKPLAVLTTPGGTSSCQGDSLLLKANSGSNYSYYWYKDNVLTTQSLDSNYYVFQSGIYYVKTITPIGGCNAISNPVSITFFNKPTGIITSQSDSICQGDSVLLSVFNNDTIATYQWKKNGNIITGAFKQDYYVTSSGSYSVDLVTNRGCLTSLSPKTISVNQVPVANFIDSVKSGCTYILKLRNTAVFKFEWRNNGNVINTTDTMITVSQTGNYSFRVINSSGCSILTNSIFLNVPNAPDANITPVNNAVICSDSSVTYQVPLTTPATYKWYKNGNLINGASQRSYTISDSGNYHVVVDNGLCVVSSSVRNVKVNISPIAVVSSNDSSFCTGDSAQLSTNNLAGLTYQWYKNNVVISNTNNSTYFAKSPGTYKVKVSLGNCDKISNPVNVTEKLLPSVPVITRNVDVLSTTTASAYQWFKNGLAISGATQQNYTVTGNGTFKVQITGNNGCKNMSTGVFVIPTGIDKAIINNLISAFPNPVYSSLHLSFAAYSNYDICISDASGRVLKLFNETSDKTVIDFTDLESGIYFVKVSSGLGSQTIRVVKK